MHKLNVHNGIFDPQLQSLNLFGYVLLNLLLNRKSKIFRGPRPKICGHNQGTTGTINAKIERA